jgi:hypothetical protein
MSKLEEFFKSNNITYEKVEIVQNDQGFSVRATEDIEEGAKGKLLLTSLFNSKRIRLIHSKHCLC